MKGKVKQINRSEWFVGSQSIQHSHDWHNVRQTCLYAVTYEGKNVIINESDVLSYFGRQKFSENLVAELNSLLRNKLIEFERNAEGDFCLKGSISRYL